MEVSGQISYDAVTFPSDKKLLVPTEYEAGLAPEPFWILCKNEKSSVLGIGPNILSHNLVSMPLIHINTLFLYVFGW